MSPSRCARARAFPAASSRPIPCAANPSSSFLSRSDHPEAAPAVGTLNADGSFAIANVPPGRYRLGQDRTLTGAGKWILSVFIKDVDVSDAPLEIAPDTTAIENMRVTLTPPARVVGTVRDAKGGPTTAGAIVIASADSRDWSPDSRRIRLVRPDTEGGFEFRLPPGRYRVIHVAKLAPGQLWDPAFLRTVAGGFAVTAVEGQAITLQLRLK